MPEWRHKTKNICMKTLSPTFLVGVFAVALGSSPAFSQVAVASTTTSPIGTIASYEPGAQTLIVRQEAAASPLTYSVTRETTFVDELGNPVVAERVTSGLPIVVHYVQENGRLVASRVIVKSVTSAPAPAPVERSVTTTSTTTTTGAGTITQYAPGSSLVLRSTGGAQPSTYAVSQTTTFVDEDGNPIEVSRISPGLPVTVHYVQEGDRLVASRVVVVREPKRKLSEDEKEALEDLREARREAGEEAREKRKDRND